MLAFLTLFLKMINLHEEEEEEDQEGGGEEAESQALRAAPAKANNLNPLGQEEDEREIEGRL